MHVCINCSGRAIENVMIEICVYIRALKSTRVQYRRGCYLTTLLANVFHLLQILRYDDPPCPDLLENVENSSVNFVASPFVVPITLPNLMDRLSRVD